MIKKVANDYVLVSLFALSGIAALIYQVCWQRLLFNAFGVDMESITIIVSAFMLGLGIGALIGGNLADRFPTKILHIFIAIEISIGIFGLSSPLLIHSVASTLVMVGHLGIGIANFCLLLFPTTLMGATLPMLVVHLHKTNHSVGYSIGQLYFFNTFGAALGSLLVGFILFKYMTINQTIYLATTFNFIVAMLVRQQVLIKEKA